MLHAIAELILSINTLKNCDSCRDVLRLIQMEYELGRMTTVTGHCDFTIPPLTWVCQWPGDYTPSIGVLVKLTELLGARIYV